MKQLIKRVAVLVVAILGVTAWTGPARAQTAQEHYEECMNQTYPDSPYHAARKECCEYVGGAWVVVYDQYGNQTDFFCDTDEGPVGREDSTDTTADTTGTAEQPDSSSTKNTQSTSTTGTAEQPQQEPSSTTTEQTTTDDGGRTTYGDWSSYDGGSSYDDPEPAPRHWKYYD